MSSKTALQTVIYLLVLIPLAFGGLNLVNGAAGFIEASAVSASLDSQFRFMSGWYLGLAALALWIAPRIEKETKVFRIVCAAVFLGGIGRLLSVLQYGWPETQMVAGLALELAFPLLILWQSAVARQYRNRG